MQHFKGKFESMEKFLFIADTVKNVILILSMIGPWHGVTKSLSTVDFESAYHNHKHTASKQSNTPNKQIQSTKT